MTKNKAKIRFFYSMDKIAKRFDKILKEDPSVFCLKKAFRRYRNAFFRHYYFSILFNKSIKTANSFSLYFSFLARSIAIFCTAIASVLSSALKTIWA